ncbi:MAG: undecaprenyl-diphosphate phosphatase [Candidatus Latescibacteria bacterium]|nr:undecaprenyl-diphosphate phosphatase [Candidatus Latescibacterota bacterium]
MTILQAAILGAVEGLTEFLPVSSTGHLILSAHAMGLVGGVMNDFEIVIQAGALLAVVWLYRSRVGELLQGAVRAHPTGRSLLLKLTVAFLPAAVVGLILHRAIKANLFGPFPVALALLVGGVAMVLFERRRRASVRAPSITNLDSVPLRVALLIGFGQILSLWPGTSRAMVTILAALLLGCTPVVAAEFSFLLALPTLGAATLFDLVRSRESLLSGSEIGLGAFLTGLAVAAIVAAIAIRSFLRYLTRHGLEPFGWYRIALGIALLVLLRHHVWGLP